MVKGHVEARSGLCDIGIGGGAFVKAMDCKGWDINPLAIEWLTIEHKLWDEQPVAAMTFWDSIEHMVDPTILLDKCEKLAFISTPIYKSAEACIKSKHFKPPEHLWYFTEQGLCRYMAKQGFSVVEANSIETTVGRDEIGTYVFRRVCYP